MIRLSDVVKEQGLTPDRLAGAMRHLSVYAAADLDKALERVAETAVLPTAIRLTPRKSGKLAGSLKIRTRVRQDVGQTEILSRLPYANTIHWGRKTLTRKGRTFESRVEGKRFIERAVEQNAGRIAQQLLSEVDQLIQKQVPRG